MTPETFKAAHGRVRDHYEAKCAALDRQIDALIYELYELTPAEIAIVEGGDKI